jgi:hypothetical protein
MSAAKLPDDPGLRYLAEILEANGAVAEICDQKWKLAHISTEMTRMMGISEEAAESYLGISPTMIYADYAPGEQEAEWIARAFDSAPGLNRDSISSSTE